MVLANVLQTDVIGECPVTYEPSGSTWSSYKVRKTKDLLACSQPIYSNTVFQAMNYRVPSVSVAFPCPLDPNHSLIKMSNCL